MIVINFKTYKQSTGENSVKVAEACEKAMKETGTEIVVAPQPQDILRFKGLETPVFSQHLDPVEPGSHTGSILAEGIKQAGATGTLINHSERRMDPDTVEKAVEKAREHDITSIVCAQSPEECGKLSEFEPDYIAFEPPELIGGDVSVSSAKPELIEEAVEQSGDIPTLTGAGIKDSEDVRISLELGCEGVLVASGVVKSDNCLEAVKELCKGYEK